MLRYNFLDLVIIFFVKVNREKAFKLINYPLNGYIKNCRQIFLHICLNEVKIFRLLNKINEN